MSSLIDSQSSGSAGRGSHDLVLIVAGAGVSMFGSTLTSIVIIFTLHNVGPLVVAGALLAELCPPVFGAPIVGWLVDRIPNRRLMITSQVVQAAAVVALALSLSSVPAVYAALFLVGCGSAVTGPTASALIPHAAGENNATKAYARLSIVQTVCMLLGSTTGGLLVDGPGARLALLVDAATFVVQALAMSRVRVDRQPDRTPTAVESRGDRSAGFRHLLRQRILVVATAGLAVMVLATVLVNVADVFFVTEVLKVGGTALGVLTACWGVGVIVGSRIAGWLSGGRTLLFGLAFGGLAMAIGLLAPSVAPHLAVSVVAWIVAGAGNGMQNVSIQAMTRVYTVDELRGRVFAAIGSTLTAANVLGTATAALVIDDIGPRNVLLAAGIGTAVAAVVVLARAIVMTTTDHSTVPEPETQVE